MAVRGVEEYPTGLVHHEGLLIPGDESDLLRTFGDSPLEPDVVGVSLGPACVMRFQRRAAGGERRVFEQPLAPRSAYVLTGAARSVWQHGIPPVRDERWSVTFRQPRRAAGD